MTDHGCKVCRVLDKRGLARHDDELITRWHGDSGERMGYRRLIDWLYTAMLRRKMERAGLPIGGDKARSRNERLTDDGTAEAVGHLLRREGVAVDDLRADFVSYSVVRTHLQDCWRRNGIPRRPCTGRLTASMHWKRTRRMRLPTRSARWSTRGSLQPAVTSRQQPASG